MNRVHFNRAVHAECFDDPAEGADLVENGRGWGVNGRLGFAR